MPFNGSGTFAKIYSWLTEQASPPIEISKLDAQETDFASGLSACLLRDGTGLPTANSDWNGKRITNLGAASAGTDAITRDACDVRYPHVLSTVGGTANAITLTPTPAASSYAAGDTYRFVATSSNTGAVTVNVSGLGSKNITKYGTTALGGGDIASGAFVEIVYDGTQFQILNVAAYASSFTGTLTGMSGATTGTVKYKISGGIASLYIDAIIEGTSNSTAMTLTGLPAALNPGVSTGRYAFCVVENSGVNEPALGLVDPVTPKITFTPLYCSAAPGYVGTNTFVSSGNKGLPVNWTFTYPL